MSIAFDCHDTAANGGGPYSIVLPSQIAVDAGRSLTIDGADADATGARHYGITLQVASGLPNGRAFVVSGSGSLTLKNLVLQGAATSMSDQGGVEITGASTFAASNVEFLNLQNSSENRGGALYLNPSSADPGSPSATIRNSSFVGNFGDFGGAVGAGAAVSVRSATYSSSLTVVNSSFNVNIALGGGAIYADTGSRVNLASDTIAGNVGFFAGGGIYSTAANFAIRNTIVANNTADFSAASNCVFASPLGVTVVGANLEYPVPDGAPNCGFSVNADPLLTFVANPVTLSSSPGLVTPYWKLGAGSPAIDAGTDGTDGTTALATDQIGDPRPSGPACDIGAYELPLQQTATSCSLRIGFFSSAGTTQFSLATGNLDNTAAGGKRTLINYLTVRGSGGMLIASPITSTVACLLPTTLLGTSPVRLPEQVDFDAIVVASGVPGIARLSTIHVTIKQDLGANPPVESVTISSADRATTFYSFDPSNSSIALRSFVIHAV